MDASWGDRETSAGGPSARAARQLGGDFVLLLLAVAILVVPSWSRSLARKELAVEERVLGPISIDVNAAPWYEWALLEGIGEARARHIVDHRKERGPFRSLDDLRAIPGLPRGWLERARRYLRVETAAAAAVEDR